MDLSANLKKEFGNGVYSFERALTVEQSVDVLEMLEGLEYSASTRYNKPVFSYNFDKCLTPTHQLVDYINSDKFYNFIRFHTGITVTKTLSCWASAYTQGHFLTPHSDAVNDRRITYLFYFHRGWKPEYGGNIAFDRQTHWQMFVPQLGTLVLFDVKDNANRHMVTQVVQDRTRYAITGWLT